MKLVFTHEDHDRLKELIYDAECPRSTLEVLAYQRLTRELLEAEVVPPEHIPPDVATMNSVLFVRDKDSGECLRVTLAWPEEADPEKHRVSVLSSLGIALLGTRMGDHIDWIMPTGKRRLYIEALMFQPESGAALSAQPEWASSIEPER